MENNLNHQKENIIPNIKPFKHLATTTGRLCDFHFHDHIEIFYCFGGRFSFWLAGETFEVGEGEVVIVAASQIHATSCTKTDKNSGYYTIQVQPSMIYDSSKITFELNYMQPFFSQSFSPRTIMPASDNCTKEISELITMIYDESVNMRYGYEFAIKSHLYKIFYTLLRYWERLGINSNMDSDPSLVIKIQSVMDYVTENFAEDITSEDMAKMAHMSYSYFSKVFKKITKQNFSKYLNQLRITEAQKLLLTTDKSITEIALDTGFSTSSYFIKQFKKSNSGVAPLQFKKAFKK
ncbi:MAG: helix-turn-helix domain-containing protein [Clostridia bacterium]|nr:helix-turn-helix domain-containing protein [Clostridia bacterium]